MPRPEEPHHEVITMTKEEIEKMYSGTAHVTHKGNGSVWISWERKGIFRAKWQSGEIPDGMVTSVKMGQDEFFSTFTSY